MRINLVGAFIRNYPFGTEIAFKKGFDRIGGHQVTTIDPSYPDQKFDEGADATIIFKWIEGTHREDLKRVGGTKVVYQPDDVRFPHIQTMMKSMREVCDHALTFDQTGADLARSFGYLTSQRLLLTADNELYRPIDGIEKDIDLCFIGSLTSGPNHTSRVRMIQRLTKHGFKVFAHGSIYDMVQMVNIYNRSKVILNHATDVGQPFGHGYGYQCRHFEAGFTRSCLLSNHVDGSDDLKWFFTFKSEEELVDHVGLLLGSKDLREVGARRFFDELNQKHLPEHRALEIVEYLKGIGV